MNNLDAEYQLFRSLCQLKCLNRTTENELLIKKIKSKGLKICLRGDIFCLDDPVIALAENKIRKALNFEINEIIHTLDILYQTGSTNKTIAQQDANNQYSILLAEFQTRGQGRREKNWLSPLAENIYLSIGFHLENAQNTHLIPLITAISICKSLSSLGIQGCQIKWPNDIYLEGKKLAGILVESFCSKKKGASFVVGIGLNVNMQSNNEIDQAWTSLCSYQNKAFDRNLVVSGLLSESLQSYNDIKQLDQTQFMYDWHLLDCLYDCEIIISDDNISYAAIAQGISDDGALLVKQKGNNTLNKIYSADVSIKPIDNN